jgi:regulator of protease activity HflC (stomatin/prohibitin superfamily)
VASDRELPPLPPSLYIDRDDLDTETFRRVAIAEQLRQTQAELAQETQRAEQATQHAAEAMRHAEHATLQAEQETRNAEQALRARAESEERNEALQRRHDQMQGSLRTFLRGYLPLLRRHLLGQRP